MTDTTKLAELDAKATPGVWTIRALENFGWNIVHYVDGDKFNIARVAKASSEADAQLIVTLVNAYRANALVPRAELEEATMPWANALANLRQGQGDTPRCEPPSDYAIERAFKDIKDVLRARAFLARQEADHG
jgi:hypothetical protein